MFDGLMSRWMIPFWCVLDGVADWELSMIHRLRRW
jgi:hypothetical protein